MQCYPHPAPNTKSSVRTYPPLFCHSDDWKVLLGAGVVALLVFCFASLILFCYVLWIAPLKFRNLSFQKRWKFLLIKFQPCVWWWAPAMLVRGICLNFTTVFFLGGTTQLWWLFIVLSVYSSATFRFAPWRSLQATIVDELM